MIDADCVNEHQACDNLFHPALHILVQCPGIVQRVKTILENIDEILAMCDVPLIWFALSTSAGGGSKVCFLLGSFTNKLTYKAFS